MNMRFYKSVTEARDEFNKEFPVKSFVKITDDEHLDKKPSIGFVCEPAGLYTRNSYKQIVVRIIDVINPDGSLNLICKKSDITITKLVIEHMTFDDFKAYRKELFKKEIDNRKEQIKKIREQIRDLNQSSREVDSEISAWKVRADEWFDIQNRRK